MTDTLIFLQITEDGTASIYVIFATFLCHTQNFYMTKPNILHLEHESFFSSGTSELLFLYQRRSQILSHYKAQLQFNGTLWVHGVYIFSMQATEHFPK